MTELQPNQGTTDEILDLDGAAKYLKCSTDALKRLLRNGNIRSFNIGLGKKRKSGLRIRKSSIDEYIALGEDEDNTRSPNPHSAKAIAASVR